MDRLLILAMLASVTLSAAGLVFESAEWTGIGPVGGWDPSHTTHIAAVLAVVAVGASALVWVRKLRKEAASRVRAEARDITERKEAEAALRESEERFRALAGSAQDAIICADGRGVIRYLNRAGERILGYAPEELVGQPLTALVPERFHKVHGEGMKRFLSTGETRVIGKTVELPGRRKDGTEFPVELSLGAWKMQGQTYFSGILRDISERKEAERALRESEEKFRLLTENIQEIFFIVEPETGREIYTSPAFEKITGYGMETARRSATGWMDTVHPEDLPRMQQKIAAGMSAAAKGASENREEEEEEEFRILRPDGTVRWLHSRAFRVPKGPGNPARIVGLISDITESKQLQDQLRQAQKLEAVGQLAGGVAHELNNPLQAIVAYANILERKIEAASSRLPEAQECRKVVKALDQAAERSTKIVRGLLSFARKDGVAMTTVDLNDLARSTAEFLGHTLGLQEVRVELDLGPGPFPVRGNPVALQQALTNLLLNAKDAMPRGGKVVLRSRRENGSVAMAVTDAGSGMTPEVQARLFEPFFTTKPPGKGTGLGLSITYGIVKEHGGTIEVESAPGKGSTFTLRLPAAGPPGAGVSGDPAGAPVPGGSS